MSTQPQNTPPETAAENPSATTIAVNGEQYNLRNLSVADANRIYEALPTEYKELADNYADLALRFERMQRVDLPDGMNWQQAWNNYLSTPRNAAGAIDAAAAPYLKQMDALFKDVPMVSTYLRTKREGEVVTGIVGTAWNAGGDALMAVPRLLGLGGAAVVEGVNAVIPGISEEQARAFGAAYAGAMLHDGAARIAMPLIDSPFNNQRSLVFSYPMEASMAGLEYASTQWPLVKDIWPLIAGIATWIGEALGNMGKEGAQTRSITEVINATKERLTHDTEGRDTSYRGLLEARLTRSDTERAATRVREAGTIAGVDVRSRADLVADGGSMVEQNGQSSAVTRGPDGKVEITPLVVPGADGAPAAPVGRLDRLREQAAGVLGNTGRRIFNGEATLVDVGAIVAGVVGAQQVVHGAVEGAARRFTGENSGPDRRAIKASQDATKLSNNADAARKGGFNLRFWENAETRATRLDGRTAELLETAERNARVVEARGGAQAASAARAPVHNLNIFRNGGRVMGAMVAAPVEGIADIARGLGQRITHNANVEARAIGNRVVAAGEDVANRARSMLPGAPAPAAATEAVEAAARTQVPAPSSRAALMGSAAQSATTQAAMEAAEAAARLPKAPVWRRAAAGVARLIPGKGRVVGAALLGTAVVATTAEAASAAEHARERFSEGDTERGNEESMNAMATVASFFSWSGGAVGFYVAEGNRLNNENHRAQRVPQEEVLALIELMSVAERGSSDDGLRKMRTLVLERDARAASGRPLDVSITVRHDGRRIISIDDATRGGGAMSMGEGMPMTYTANLNTKLMEEARLYLGSHGTLESVARELGIPNEVRDRIMARHRNVEADAGITLAVAETHQRTEARREQRTAAAPAAQPRPQPQVQAGPNPIEQAVHEVQRSVTVGLVNVRRAADNFQLPQLPKIELRLPFGG